MAILEIGMIYHGLQLYRKKYVKDEKRDFFGDGHLSSSFLGAINVFSKEAFGDEINAVSLGDRLISMVKIIIDDGEEIDDLIIFAISDRSDKATRNEKDLQKALFKAGKDIKAVWKFVSRNNPSKNEFLSNIFDTYFLKLSESPSKRAQNLFG